MSKKRSIESVSEPLLEQLGNSRFTIFPLRYPDIWEMYEIQRKCFWVHTEIGYDKDLADWEKLTNNERYFVEHILAFFAGSDGIVLENLVSNFCEEIQIPEARFVYAFQAMMENEHSAVYGKLIETLVKDKTRKKELFNAIDTIPCVKEKADWAKKWMNRDSSFASRLIAFAIVEGIFFSGSFCAIFWLRNRRLMINGLGKSNEFISRDEGLHTDFAILLYTKYIKNKLPESEVFSIFKEAVEIESKFITASIPCKMIGMNSDLMIQYIQFVANRLLLQLGYNKLYDCKNPFDFMNLISIPGKTNMHEGDVTEYQSANSKKDHFSLSESF